MHCIRTRFLCCSSGLCALLCVRGENRGDGMEADRERVDSAEKKNEILPNGGGEAKAIHYVLLNVIMMLNKVRRGEEKIDINMCCDVIKAPPNTRCLLVCP